MQVTSAILNPFVGIDYLGRVNIYHGRRFSVIFCPDCVGFSFQCLALRIKTALSEQKIPKNPLSQLIVETP